MAIIINKINFEFEFEAKAKNALLLQAAVGQKNFI